MKYLHIACLISFFSIVCGGCRLGPTYQSPYVETPEEWKSAPSCPNDQASIPFWWEIFNDDTLSCLEQQAIVQSPQLFAALDRVAEARAIVGVDRSSLYPHLNLAPTYSDSAQLFKLYLPPGFGTAPGASFPTIYRIHQFQYTMPLNMSYEIDLWGKLRGQYDSAVYSAQAREEDLQSALLTLTADLAVAYYKLRALDAQLSIAEYHVSLMRNALQLTQSRFKKGIVNEQDTLTAEQNLSNSEAAYYDISQQRAIEENAIAVYIGTPPSLFHLDRTPLTSLPPNICPNLPSEVLLQRPDIRAAERTAAAQHAMIGVAYASFFPSIQLTGALGFSSPDLVQFLSWKSRLWGLGASAAQTVFDAGRNKSNLDLQYALFNEASNDYQQQVLIAFQEVEDSLVTLEMETKQYRSYQISAEAANKRTQLSSNRYQKGLSNYLEVINNEVLKTEADSTLVNMQGLRFISTIQLIKALGGTLP